MKKPRKPSKSHGHSAMQSLAAKEAQGHMLQQALAAQAAQQAGPGQSIGMPPQAAPMAGAPMMGPPGMKKGGRVKC